jgi:apolipoprotein N-acyltransferase
LWSPEGFEVGEYAKRHRVPYGEWVPWRSFLERIIDEVDQIPRDFAPGRTRGLFDIRDTRIATIICFESMFGAEVRSLVRDGAELIVVSTNNRSYRRSANSEQHLAAAQIRAVETGRPVLQAAISGISAVVEADGEVVDRQPLLENGVVQGTIRTRGGTTAYVRFGEWVLWGSGLVVLGSLLSRLRARGLLAGCLADRESRSVDSGAV